MKSDEELLAELQEAVKGLNFTSESDYPLEVVHWLGVQEISAEYLYKASGQPATTPLQITSADEFFRVATSEAEWKSKEELATAKRY